jgi:hypothetical protein
MMFAAFRLFSLRLSSRWVDLAGIALAFFELRAIARGERPIAGKNLSMIGLVICSIVLAIKAFLLLAVFT